MSSVVCLDLGTKTGFAVLDKKTGGVASGTVSFRTGKIKGHAPSRFEWDNLQSQSGGGERFVRFREFLDKLNEENIISKVWFEAVRNHKGVDAAHVYGGMLAILTAWCEVLNIPYAGVPVGSIKKSVTGKGNASKEEVIRAIQEKGFFPSDDNEADALAILILVEGAKVKPS